MSGVPEDLMQEPYSLTPSNLSIGDHIYLVYGDPPHTFVPLEVTSMAEGPGYRDVSINGISNGVSGTVIWNNSGWAVQTPPKIYRRRHPKQTLMNQAAIRHPIFTPKTYPLINQYLTGKVEEPPYTRPNPLFQGPQQTQQPTQTLFQNWGKGRKRVTKKKKRLTKKKGGRSVKRRLISF